MSTQRLHLPVGRDLLEMLRRSRWVAVIIEMLRVRAAPLPEPDTSIAWEDGEADDDPARRA